MSAPPTQGGPPLPPGWKAQWDPNAGTYLFIDPSGRSQWNHPSQPQQTFSPPPQSFPPQPAQTFSPPPSDLYQSPPNLATPQVSGNRPPIPPTSPEANPGVPLPFQNQGGFTPPGHGHGHSPSISNMMGVEGGFGPSHKRRAYAKDQIAAYGGSISGPQSWMTGPNGYPSQPGQQVPEPQTPLFTPGIEGSFGQQQLQHPPTGLNAPRVGGPSPVPFTPTPSQPPSFATQQQQGLNQLVNQFGNMRLGGSGGVQTSGINLVGSQLPVWELNGNPTPEIKLPPGACLSQSPNCVSNPMYQRCTLNSVPTTDSLLKKSKIPFALVVSPHRSLKGSDPEVPVAPDTVIARCRRCRTYINPYVTFVDGGNRWKCCMCNMSNDVPQLFDWDQAANQPGDRWKRPELNNTVVEFMAPVEYLARPPQCPTYVFLIDVSYAAINCGMVATAARTILESLDRLPNTDNRTKISIIAVDTSLYFFSLTPGNPDPSMLVVGGSDLDEVFLPKNNDLLVNLTENRAGVESLLGKLSDMFKENHNVGSAMGAALQAAYKMTSTNGAKIMVLSATLPTIGPGALKSRDDPKVLGTPKESTLLQVAHPFYKNLSIEFGRAQISVDMWLFSSTYTDVATLSALPRYTGGQTYFYPAFNASRQEDAIKFAHEFGEILASPICLEALFRVRCSRGLRLAGFHGNVFVRSTDLLTLPAAPLDQSYTIELAIEDNLTQPFVVIQSAVLETTSFGERRIRVCTLALPTTNNLSEIYANCDQLALATLLANKAVERTIQSKLEDARDAIINKLVDILGTYKATMTATGSGPSPQLMISDNLKFLPLLMLGLLKHVGIRQSAQIPPDLRSYAQALLTTMPTQLLIPYLHPNFYCLHNMAPECGTIDDNGVILPPTMNLSSEKFERHGLFLIEDGQNMFLWLGRDAVPQLLKDLFDIDSYANLRAGKITLPLLENSFSKRVNAIIGKIREMRRAPYYPHLYLVKEDGDPAMRLWALSCLIEDRTDQLPSYQQFIGQLKDKVNGAGY